MKTISLDVKVHMINAVLGLLAAIILQNELFLGFAVMSFLMAAVFQYLNEVDLNDH